MQCSPVQSGVLDKFSITGVAEAVVFKIQARWQERSKPQWAPRHARSRSK